MIPIQKGKEPPGLVRLRNKAADRHLSPKKAYKRLHNPLKKRVRNSLIREQGGLCAYCMCRIPRTDVPPQVAPIIIEHMVPRDPEDGRDVGQGLDYNNLLAVCHGNKSIGGEHHFEDLTCDAHRGNIEFRKVNPCDPKTLETIYYHLDGEIDAEDPDVRYDLVETLNLNCPSSPLKAERRAALESLIGEITSVPGEYLLEYSKVLLEEFERETNPKTPYVGILIWYLKSLLD